MSAEDRLREILEGQDEPVSMPTHERVVVKVQAGDLREAAEANKSHPVAPPYLKATRRVPASYQLMVEAVDLRALLENRQVVLTEDKGIQRKSLGGPLGAQPEVSPDVQSLREGLATEDTDEPPEAPEEDSSPVDPQETEREPDTPSTDTA